MADQNVPDRESGQEPAEGSRETVSANLGADAGARERERFDTERAQRGKRTEEAGGITNRPLDEEVENQRELPERGTAKNPDEDHA